MRHRKKVKKSIIIKGEAKQGYSDETRYCHMRRRGSVSATMGEKASVG